MPSFLRILALTGLLFLPGVLFVVRGQETRQQRPRRVTAGPEQSGSKNSGDSNEPQAKAQESRPQEVDAGDVVRVETQLVSVPAVVTNTAGRPLTGLRNENFVLFENGEQQKITNFATTDAPFEIALLLDTSGSTRNDMALIREAALSFIEALRPGDRVAIIGFAMGRQGPGVEVLSKLTDDRNRLRGAIENLRSSAGTPYYDALERIADEVFAETPRPEVIGRRAFIALTDGVDSSGKAEFETARAKLMRARIASYFIQVNTEEFVENAVLKPCGEGVVLSTKQLQRYRRVFAPRSNPEDYADFCGMGSFERMQVSRDLYSLARREMNELAKASGGKNFQAASLQDARAAFALVATEIGTQYSLGYYPTNKARDGKFRTIRVEVQGVPDKPKVRAREGYNAPKS